MKGGLGATTTFRFTILDLIFICGQMPIRLNVVYKCILSDELKSSPGRTSDFINGTITLKKGNSMVSF